MHRKALMGIVTSILLLTGASANADQTFTGTSGADTYVMGVHSGAIKVCLVGSGTLTAITAASTTLDENVTFNAGDGADTIKILSSGDSNENVCSVTLTSGFTDGGFVVDVNGENDNDIIRGGIDIEGDLHGNAGNDRLRLRAARPASARSVAYGDAGDDNLCATNLTNGDMDLDGGDGADIFEVASSAGATGFEITYELGNADGDADIYDDLTPFEFETRLHDEGAADDGQNDPASTCLSI